MFVSLRCFASMKRDDLALIAEQGFKLDNIEALVQNTAPPSGNSDATRSASHVRKQVIRTQFLAFFLFCLLLFAQRTSLSGSHEGDVSSLASDSVQKAEFATILRDMHVSWSRMRDSGLSNLVDREEDLDPVQRHVRLLRMSLEEYAEVREFNLYNWEI
jgi:hypothetical protein